MRPTINETYMSIADCIAQRSKAKRKKVGAVLVKNKQIISDGYNGMPAGDDSDPEHYVNGVLTTKPEVLHAEENVIAKLTKIGGVSADDSTLYVTYSPCLHCAKLLYNAGVKFVYYKEEYRCIDGIEFLRKYGVQVVKLLHD